MPDVPDLVTSAAVCAGLGIDRSTLSRWVQLGRITPALRAPGRYGAMLFDPADVTKLHERYKVAVIAGWDAGAA